MKNHKWLHERWFIVEFDYSASQNMYFDYTNYHTPENDQYGCRTRNCDREQALIFARLSGEMRYLVYMRYLWCNHVNNLKLWIG